MIMFKDFHRGDLRVKPSKSLKSIFFVSIDSAYYHFQLKSFRKVVPKVEKIHSGASKFQFLKVATSDLLGVGYVWEMLF